MRDSDPICNDRIWARKSQDARTCSGTRRGSAWWQEIRPQSRPSTTTETDMEAAVPMLRMYSRWIGDTLRSVESDRSIGVPVIGSTSGRIGTGR